MTFGWLPHAAPYENAVHARLRSRCRGLPWRIAAIGKVQEVEAGTYSISVSRTTGIATDTNKTLSAAVDKAGEFCHAKGQKFLLKSAVGNSVVFRCVSTGPSPE